jgi:HTH-type transcriptional regulator, sugar sensing transcriptional regulator
MATKEMFELLKIGLTEGEAKVYLSLSELGSSTVGPIVKDSKVAYSNIYDILNRLIDKGIVSFIIKNKTKHFQAAPPANLIEYLNKKEKEISEQKIALKNVLSKIEELQEGKQNQEAEVFIGIRGLKTAYEKLLKNSSKNDEELFFYLHNEEYAEQSDIFYNNISPLMKGIRNRGICNVAYKNSWFAKKSKNLNIRFVDFPIPGNIDIIKDNVMIITWKPSPIAILIHSQTVANNFREYFNQVWDMGRK